MLYALTAILSFFLGHYLREVKDLLLTVKNRVGELKSAQDKAEGPKTNFAEPMTRAEMAAELEEEKIRMLNQ